MLDTFSITTQHHNPDGFTLGMQQDKVYVNNAQTPQELKDKPVFIIYNLVSLPYI
jgi:hypothetical protein